MSHRDSARWHVVLCVQNLSVPKDPRVWREARTLAEAGFEVTVVSPRDPGQSKTEVLQGVRIVRYRSVAGTGAATLVLETVLGLLAISWHVLRAHMRKRVHVLHVANPPDTYFGLGKVLRLLGAKFVFDQHDPAPEVLRAKLGTRRWLMALMQWCEVRSLRAADLVITTNNSCRRRAIALGGLPAARVVVVRTGPDSVSEAPATDAPNETRVAFAGVMGEQDGVETLLRAIARVRERRPDVRLDLIGDGPDVERLEACVDAAGIRDIVTWTGWLSRAEMRERLAGATIAVSPDPDSELNRLISMLKVGDYLAEGLAVIASDLPETRVTCADAARYVSPGDVAALADAIDELLGDAHARAALRAAARARANRLVWGPSGERLVAAYRNLLGAGPAIPEEQSV